MTEDSIAFDERVNDVYPFGVPRVFQPVEIPNDFETLVASVDAATRVKPNRRPARRIDEVTLRTVHRELLGTARSIRYETEPATVLHALLLEDELPLGRIAGMIHQDPRDLAFQLEALCEMGWVRRTTRDTPPRYSIVGLGRD